MTQPTWIGKNIGGRYLIEAELGQGGMASVYKATDPNLKRIVAVKLIHTHLSKTQEFVRRFEAEAAAVAQLRHPHIVQVFDFNHDGEVYFIVFEFVPGETLQDRLKRLRESRRQMALNNVIKYAIQVGDALSYAHSRDLVHRDVKPANVMLNVQGDAILTDFGVVKIVGGTQHTATGAVLGTARYISPEQIKGQKVDERTDIYSFGVMLYEMVSGQPPYNADSAMTLMMMHVNDPIPDVKNLRTDVPSSLVLIIERALAKDPAHRYQSMADLVADLRAVQSGGVPETAARQSAPPPVPPVSTPSRTAAADTGRTEVLSESERMTPPPMVSVTSTGRKNTRRNVFIIGIAAIAVILLAYFGFRGNGGDEDGEETPTNVAEVAAEETAVAEVVDTENTPTPELATSTQATEVIPPTATDEPTDIPATDTPTEPPPPTATEPPPPTATTAPPTATTAPPTATTAPPTATTPPVTQLSVRINSISLDGNQYVVSYETFGYTEQLPGQHIHFYFNTVPHDQAGVPGAGPWFLYGGPRPFTGYGVNDRPGGATQMCALVANEDHTVIANSGNCVDLP